MWEFNLDFYHCSKDSKDNEWVIITIIIPIYMQNSDVGKKFRKIVARKKRNFPWEPQNVWTKNTRFQKFIQTRLDRK